MQTIFKMTCLTAVLAVSACAANDPYRNTKSGTAVGAVAGAAVGYGIDDGKGAAIGAAVGALTGAAIGNYMDRQQQALDQALAEEQRRSGLQVERLQDGSIKLDIPSEVSFDFNKADIKPAFVPSLTKVSNILMEYDQTTVDIIGHTDNIGSDSYNMVLSERRAQSVAGFLTSRGVPSQRLGTEGRGEREPRADNSTEAGRQLNRRVEMLIRAVAQEQAPQYDPRFPQGGDPANPQGLPSY